MEWIALVAFGLLMIGILLLQPWKSAIDSKSPTATAVRKSDRGARNEVRQPPAESTRIMPDHTDQRPSEKERDEMLDGVRNLARDNPKKVASMMRHWMKE